MNKLRYALVAVAASGAAGLASGSASAMPNGLGAAANAATSNVQDVRWVCGGPYRCWWRPNYYGYGAYGYYGPRRYWGPGWGYRHHWHRW